VRPHTARKYVPILTTFVMAMPRAHIMPPGLCRIPRERHPPAVFRNHAGRPLWCVVAQLVVTGHRSTVVRLVQFGLPANLAFGRVPAPPSRRICPARPCSPLSRSAGLGIGHRPRPRRRSRLQCESARRCSNLLTSSRVYGSGPGPCPRSSRTSSTPHREPARRTVQL